MKKLNLVIALVSIAIGVNAQQQQQFSLFQFYKQGFNPGYVGSTGPLSGTLDYRNQWVNTAGAPVSFNAGVHGLLSGSRSQLSRHGMGLMFSSDQIGVTNNNSVALQYAYRLPVSEKTTLSFGLQGSYLQTVSRFGELIAADPNDPIASGTNTSDNLNIGAGLYLYAEKFFAGLSAPGLLDQPKGLNGERNPIVNARHYYAMGGFVQPVSKLVKLRLTTLVKTTVLSGGKKPATADFNLAAIFADRLLLGASYRTDNTVLAMAQIQLTRALNVAYGFDFNTANIGRPAGFSHEIVLGFNLVSKKAAFTTPRFISYF